MFGSYSWTLLNAVTKVAIDFLRLGTTMDCDKHGEIQGRYLVFLKLTALYFTMSDIVHSASILLHV